MNFFNSIESIVFSSRDYALRNELSASAATGKLKRLESKGVIVQLTRGLWANPSHPYFDPVYAVPYLLGNEQGYISFLTALSQYGLISQIPQVIQVASTGRSRSITTPVANYEIIQLNPAMFSDGINFREGAEGLSYQIASPEKALLDTLYISSRKGKRFDSLPELDFETGFSEQKFLGLLSTCVPDKRISSAITRTYRSLNT